MTFKKQRPSSILGLAFDGNRLEIAVLRRANGHFQVQKSASAQLALSPLTGDPELVGREIRNVLDQADIREKRCVVGLPLSWMQTLQVSVPDLSKEDIESFLQIETERGFHSDPATLTVAQSRCQMANNRQATLLAVPRSQIANLETALKSAQLKPASLSPAIAALHEPQSSNALALSVGAGSIDLQISCGGGIAALRSLEGAVESEGNQKRLDADVAAREIRITLGQLPAEFQAGLKNLKVFGRGELARRFVADITPRAEAMGLKIELLDRCAPGCFENVTPGETPLSPALALAARFLSGTTQPLEFLPPKISPWRRFVSTKVSARKIGLAAGAVGGIMALIAGAFLAQEYQISTLNGKLLVTASKYSELDEAQKQIRRFRPWFDESFHTLTLLRRLTEAFPEDGRVTAKTLEIRETALVTCSGTAKDNQSLLRVLEKLRATKGFGDVKLENVRGQAPVIFTFNLQWLGDSANAN